MFKPVVRTTLSSNPLQGRGYGAYEIAKTFVKVAIIGTSGTLLSVALKRMDLLPTALEKVARHGFGAMVIIGIGAPIAIGISILGSNTFVIGPSKRYN